MTTLDHHHKTNDRRLQKKWRCLLLVLIAFCLLGMVRISITAVTTTSSSYADGLDLLLDQPTILTKSRLPASEVVLVSNDKESSASKEEEEESFSACLLIMDDNHYLLEWIAYHYTKLPLRRLIVAVDPRSNYSPLPVLNRWKHRINITLWDKDDEYMADPIQTLQTEGCRGAHNYRKNNPRLTKSELERHHWLIIHRLRQRVFMTECMKRLKLENRTWTLLIDTDEYLNVNQYASEIIQHSLSKIPSSNQENDDGTHHPNDNSTIHQNTAHRLASTTILQRIHEIQNYNLTLNKMYYSGCIGIPRLPFGVKESTTDEIQNQVPLSSPTFNASQFSTLRWRYSYQKERNGKPMIDVSKLEWKHLQLRSVSVHPGITSYCDKANKDIRILPSYFVAHHYAGSFEQWKFRKSDPRGWKLDLTYEQYLAKYKDIQYSYSDDTIRGWLNEFVNYVGIHDAQKLLRGVGSVQQGEQHQAAMYNFANPLSFEWCQRWHHHTGTLLIHSTNETDDYTNIELEHIQQQSSSVQNTSSLRHTTNQMAPQLSKQTGAHTAFSEWKKKKKEVAQRRRGPIEKSEYD